MKKDAERSSSGNNKSIQLWHHRRVLTEDGRVSIDHIYLVEYEVSSQDRMSITQACVKESVATYYIYCASTSTTLVP